MIRIREARPEDATAITNIHIQSRQEAMPWLPNLHTDDETQEWIANVVLPNQQVWVAEFDGIVAGFAAVSGEMLEQLYVSPGFQGKGLGTALLAKSIEIGDRPLRLWTFQRNEAARAFYFRRGFREITFTDGADNEENEPDVLFEHAPSSDT